MQPSGADSSISHAAHQIWLQQVQRQTEAFFSPVIDKIKYTLYNYLQRYHPAQWSQRFKGRIDLENFPLSLLTEQYQEEQEGSTARHVYNSINKRGTDFPSYHGFNQPSLFYLISNSAASCE